MKIGPKQVGVAVIALAVVVGVLVFLFNQSITASAEESCSCSAMAEGGTCPHRNNLPYQTYLGGLVVLGLIGVGIYSIWSAKQKEGLSKINKRTVNGLPIEEKKIYDLLESQSGAMFQSELVSKSQESKVKVSRILDKLEGRGLIERRRQGMTNLVIIKRN